MAQEEQAEAVAIAPRGVSGDSTGKDRVKAPLADYFAIGVAAVEVLLDVMTGEYLITRADVTVDAGQSLNPAVDVCLRLLSALVLLLLSQPLCVGLSRLDRSKVPLYRELGTTQPRKSSLVVQPHTSGYLRALCTPLRPIPTGCHRWRTRQGSLTPGY